MMPQVKVSIETTQVEFLKDYVKYGFKDKSSMVRAALNRFISELELENLKESAELYAEVYRGDAELQDLTHSAMSGWPE
jgi:Arc/MetJ-type ribon-helix-helix transcriptional regulator